MVAGNAADRSVLTPLPFCDLAEVGGEFAEVGGDFAEVGGEFSANIAGSSLRSRCDLAAFT